MMARFVSLVLMLAFSGRGQSELQRCSSTYMHKDDCPDWHYCDTSGSACRPCFVCNPWTKTSRSINNCSPPVACTYGSENIICPKLYPIFGNTSLIQDEYSYLGTNASVTCQPPGALSPETFTLRCEAKRQSVDSVYFYANNWSGNMSCVTIVKPTVPTTLKPVVIDETFQVTLIVTFCVVAVVILVAIGVGCRVWKSQSKTDSCSRNPVEHSDEPKGTEGSCIITSSLITAPVDDLDEIAISIECTPLTGNSSDNTEPKHQINIDDESDESSHRMDLSMSESDLTTENTYSTDDTEPKHQLWQNSDGNTDATSPSSLSDTTYTDHQPPTLLTSDDHDKAEYSCYSSDQPSSSSHYPYSLSQERYGDETSCETSSSEFPEKNHGEFELDSNTGQKEVIRHKEPEENECYFDNQHQSDTSNVLPSTVLRPYGESSQDIHLLSVDKDIHRFSDDLFDTDSY